MGHLVDNDFQAAWTPANVCKWANLYHQLAPIILFGHFEG
jgi:hypothetical protein